VTHYRFSIRINGEEISNKLGKLFCNICKHVKVLVPRSSSGVTVVSSTITNFPVLVLINFSEIESTGRSIRENHSDVVLFSVSSKSRLLGGIILVTSESRKEI